MLKCEMSGPLAKCKGGEGGGTGGGKMISDNLAFVVSDGCIFVCQSRVSRRRDC